MKTIFRIEKKIGREGLWVEIDWQEFKGAFGISDLPQPLLRLVWKEFEHRRRINSTKRHAAWRREYFGKENPLNSKFPGCEKHHIDRNRVIYIPKLLHRSITHSIFDKVSMKKINNLAFEWMKKERIPGGKNEDKRRNRKDRTTEKL